MVQCAEPDGVTVTKHFTLRQLCPRHLFDFVPLVNHRFPEGFVGVPDLGAP